eukprot:767337-Hanusia_phi.AAC.9
MIQCPAAAFHRQVSVQSEAFLRPRDRLTAATGGDGARPDTVLLVDNSVDSGPSSDPSVTECTGGRRLRLASKHRVPAATLRARGTRGQLSLLRASFYTHTELSSRLQACFGAARSVPRCQWHLRLPSHRGKHTIR